MTDHLDPLDDLASAHLDGETTPAEAARVASDPQLSARVERLAEARDALRAADMPSDPARRAQAIAAALAAYDEEVVGALDAATANLLVPAAARWRRPPRRALALVGIAAAVALLALAAPLIDRLDSGSHDDLAALPDDGADDMTLRDSGAGQEATAGAADRALAAAPSAATPDLGPFGVLPDLADAVRSQLETGPAASGSSPAAASQSTATAAAAPAPCAEERAAGEPVLYTALAELAGRLVVVLVREEPDGGRTLVVLDRQDCSTVTAGRL